MHVFVEDIAQYNRTRVSIPLTLHRQSHTLATSLSANFTL